MQRETNKLRVSGLNDCHGDTKPFPKPLTKNRRRCICWPLERDDLTAQVGGRRRGDLQPKILNFLPRLDRKRSHARRTSVRPEASVDFQRARDGQPAAQVPRTFAFQAPEGGRAAEVVAQVKIGLAAWSLVPPTDVKWLKPQQRLTTKVQKPRTHRCQEPFVATPCINIAI